MTGRKFIEWFSSSPRSFGVNLEPSETDTEGPLFRGGKGQLFLHQLCKAFIDTIESAHRDDKLTSKGRADLILREAQRLLAELRGNFKKFLDPCANAYQNFDSTRLPALRRATDALSAVERLRIQQSISNLEVKDRVEVLENALRDNDEVVLGTLFDRPQLHRLLDPSLISQARRKYMSQNAPDVIAAETAAAVLTFDFEKVTDELSLFMAGPSSDAVEIHKHLAEIKKLGMAFESNADLEWMLNGGSPSGLPQMDFSSLSDGADLSTASR